MVIIEISREVFEKMNKEELLILLAQPGFRSFTRTHDGGLKVTRSNYGLQRREEGKEGRQEG